MAVRIVDVQADAVAGCAEPGRGFRNLHILSEVMNLADRGALALAVHMRKLVFVEEAVDHIEAHHEVDTMDELVVRPNIQRAALHFE